MGIQKNAISDSMFEPLFGLAGVVVPAGPALPAGYSTFAFVDDVGQSAAGNVTIVEGDTNQTGGQIAQGVAFELANLTVFARLSTFASAPTEAGLLALGTGMRVRLHYAEQIFELGPLQRFLGPYGAPTGLNGAIVPQRLAPVIDGQGKTFVCEPAQKFKLEFKANRLIDAGVAVATYVLHVVMERRAARRGSAAIKQ